MFSEVLKFLLCLLLSFIIENKKNNRKPFLDVNINRKQGIFASSVYRRSTLSGIYTHFDIFYHPPIKAVCSYVHCYIDVFGFAQ